MIDGAEDLLTDIERHERLGYNPLTTPGAGT
jgi:hypothetical protein